MWIKFTDTYVTYLEICTKPVLFSRMHRKKNSSDCSIVKCTSIIPDAPFGPM